MPNNQFINLEELSVTTQALLSKINEQSNLKVNKHNVSAEYTEGTKIAEIEDVEIYAPIQEIDTSNFVTHDDLSDFSNALASVAYNGDYNDLDNTPNLSNYMVKQQDYVTAGRLPNSIVGTKATIEGCDNIASGQYSHAEGYSTTASGECSHAEGWSTIASATGAHAEGYSTKASGEYSHAENFSSTASGKYSHAEGCITTASGKHSHAEGYFTTAQRQSQHVFGEYNIADTSGTTASRGTYIEIVGKGTATNYRSNARTLDWSGNEWLAGKLTVGTGPSANMDVTTKQYVDNAVNGITIPVTSVNGATGAITITATGIGALPDSTVIPTKTSDLTNDSNYLSGSINSMVDSGSGYLIYRNQSYLSTNLAKSIYIGINGGTAQYLQIGRSHSDEGIKGQIRLSNTDSNSDYTTITPSATTAITITLPNTTGTLALASKVVSSVNGATGAVTVNKLKTTASENNTKYNLIGTTTSNNSTSAVNVYNQDLLSFAKTSSLARLTIGSTAIPGVVRVYTSADSASGFTDIKSNASSTNERTITLPDASGTVALTTDIPSVPSWALATSKPSYAFSELTSHPTTLNDYGITDAYTKTEVDGLVSGVLHYKGAKSTTGALPSSGNTTGDVWHVTADGSEWAWDGSDWQELGTAIDLSGYLQTGDIAAWAKAANKPSYTASEVGALPSTYTAPVTSVNGQTGTVTLTIPAAQVQSDWNATSGMGAILNKPTIPAATTVTQTLTSGTKIGEVNGVSLYAPEAGNQGIATETDPIFSASPAAGITSENITAWNAKSNFSGSYNDLSDKPTIPTVPTNISAFTNDSGYLTSYTETDPTVPAWAKASTKPTYTASEVGAAASSHVHGNVKNDGTITVNTSMANGDRLLFSDASDSNKIKNTSITIGTSTTQYLANNGTWQNLPTISVSQALTSGTEIGSVNNTKLYAPTPYDDSALAARVTALEQLEWATYYSGRSNPSNSQGQNGDIYLQY